MFRRLNSLLPGSGTKASATSSTASSTTADPSLKPAPSPKATPGASPSKPKAGRIFTVGNRTIEIHFRELLAANAEEGNGVPLSLLDRIKVDMVAAAIYVSKTDPTIPSPSTDDFIPVLTRCITSTYETVEFADECMEEQTGVSAMKWPALQQVLVAAALKHRNKDLLQMLVGKGSPPEKTIFRFSNDVAEVRDAFASIVQDPNYGRQAWLILVDAGWADASALPPLPPASTTHSQALPAAALSAEAGLQTVQTITAQCRTDPAAALAALDDLIATGWDPQPYTWRVLKLLASSGTADMLVRFLLLVPRALYDGIPPHPRWPGEPNLVTMVAARGDGDDGLAVLRVLVEIGGMDVDIHVWYKAGIDSHPQNYDPWLPDGSRADDSPLLAAVHAGNVAVVEYLLRKGAQVEDARERAAMLGRDEVVAVLDRWTAKEK